MKWSILARSIDDEEIVVIASDVKPGWASYIVEALRTLDPRFRYYIQNSYEGEGNEDE